jgi:hypothetical protein
MTDKAAFNAEEWQVLLEAPALAGLVVVASQRGGAIRESFGIAKAYGEARKEHEADLIGEIASTPPPLKRGEFKSAEELRAGAFERLGEAVSLLKSKATPEELEAYRGFTLSVAQRAAEADKSGGVLGIGGERVSDSERAALGELAAALGTEPPA